MSKKTITIIAVPVVLALLGAGYYWSLNRQKDDSASSPYEYTPPVVIGDLASWELVKIETPNITLEKIGDVWELALLDGAIPQAKIDLDQRQITSMTYSLAGIWTDMVVEEEPEDLSVFGLDEPSLRITVTDSSGREAQYLLGNMTPSLASYYIMEEGNPAVYTIPAYTATVMQFNLDSIRLRDLLPYIDEYPVHLVIESPSRRLEVIQRADPLPLHLASTYSAYILTSPYLLPRGTDSEKFGDLVNTLNYLIVDAIIDDNPSSLRPYGLDTPVRITYQGETQSLDLLIGNAVGNLHYAKLPGSQAVFTVAYAGNFLEVNPFSLIDKFALLVNIQTVERITISGEGRTLRAELDDRNRDLDVESDFYLDGKRAEDASFRLFYRAVIGLLVDAEIPQTALPDIVWDPENDENITIEYQLYEPPGARVSITLIPYSRDFYVLRQEGTMEFFIARSQVRRIFETADAVVFPEQ